VGLNLFHVVHAAGTIPSRLDLAYHSDYAVNCAKANRDRTVKAQANRLKIAEYNEEAAQARHKTDMALMKFKTSKAARRQERIQAIAGRVKEGMAAAGAR
jgi:hypothetical protein